MVARAWAFAFAFVYCIAFRPPQTIVMLCDTFLTTV